MSIWFVDSVRFAFYLVPQGKEILSTNWDFFEKLAAALAEKKLLSAVDIEKIRGECRIIPEAP